MINKIKTFIVCLIIASSSTGVLAASIGDAPLEIRADHLVVEHNKGTAVYTGHVVAQQDQFFLYGDKLEIYTEQGKVQKVVVYGSPASFKKYDKEAKGWTHGKARTITYHLTPSKLLKLQQDAQVTQASGETLLSHQIQYQINSKTLSASGSKQQRVHVILPTQEEE